MNEDDFLLEMYSKATGYEVQDLDINEVQNAFFGTAYSEEEFVEQLMEEQGVLDKIPNNIVIDWKGTWEENFSHDYWTAEAEDGTIYFFLTT